MAGYKPSSTRQQKAQTAPQEPNLVPIMNLFLTIIPFMLMMVVVSQVALVALNFSQGEGGGSGSGAGGGGKTETDKVEIHIMGMEYSKNNQFLGMEIREGSVTTSRITAVNENYDYVSLDKTIKEIRARKADLVDITVLVHPDVLYRDLIRTIDLCKINGFSQVHYTAPKVQYY